MTSPSHAQLLSELAQAQSELRAYKRIASSALETMRGSTPSTTSEGSPSSLLWLSTSDSDIFRSLFDKLDAGVYSLEGEGPWYLQAVDHVHKAPSTIKTIFQRSFPVEILTDVTQYLSQHDLSHVCATSLEFASAFLPLLYRNVRVKVCVRQNGTDVDLSSLFGSRVSQSIPSRINNLLSLSNISSLTVNASLLVINSEIHLSSPLLLECFTIHIDIDHLVYDDDGDYSNDPYSFEVEFTPRILGKTIFCANLSLLSVINPRQLVIDANDLFDGFVAFLVHPDTARIISSWTRLRLAKLKDALFYTTSTRANRFDVEAHELVPLPGATSDAPAVHFQIHLSYIESPFPVPDSRDDILRLTLPSYLIKLAGTRASQPFSLCFSSRLARHVMEVTKSRYGQDWPAHFQICSSEEADAMSKGLLEEVDAS